MTGQEAIRPYAEGFEALQHTASPESPDWLAALRRNAFAHFSELGFPAPRTEDWKYSPTRPLEQRAFGSLPGSAETLSPEAIRPVLLNDPAHTLVFVDGVYVPELGGTLAETTGLHIQTLRDAMQENSGLIESRLTQAVNWQNDTFTALNTAFLQEGILIELQAGTQLDTPLQIVFVSTRRAQPSACHPRILLQANAGAHAVLVETWWGLDGAANFSNSFMQIALAESAQLEHLRLQRENVDEFHVSRVFVEQQAGSRYLSHTLNFGGRWIRNDLHANLHAPEAETVFNGLYITQGRQHIDNHTRIDHLAPETRSDELYRGIIDDQGHAVFNGKVVVAEHALKTDAAQANNNLLLSRHAEIDTKPELEIYADDVKCSHGATIGQLDESALFYLRSRGLGLEEARGLLVGAFAFAVLDRITSPVLRKFAREQLTAVLPQSAALESA